MELPDGDIVNDKAGCVLEFVAKERFVFTAAMGPGFRPLRGEMPFTAVISDCAPEGDGTRYSASAMDTATPEDARSHREMGFHEGWGAALDQLVARLGPLTPSGGRRGGAPCGPATRRPWRCRPPTTDTSHPHVRPRPSGGQERDAGRIEREQDPRALRPVGAPEQRETELGWLFEHEGVREKPEGLLEEGALRVGVAAEALGSLTSSSTMRVLFAKVDTQPLKVSIPEPAYACLDVGEYCRRAREVRGDQSGCSRASAWARRVAPVWSR